MLTGSRTVLPALNAQQPRHAKAQQVRSHHCVCELFPVCDGRGARRHLWPLARTRLGRLDNDCKSSRFSSSLRGANQPADQVAHVIQGLPTSGQGLPRAMVTHCWPRDAQGCPGLWLPWYPLIVRGRPFLAKFAYRQGRPLHLSSRMQWHRPANQVAHGGQVLPTADQVCCSLLCEVHGQCRQVWWSQPIGCSLRSVFSSWAA
jgi:hypothetical protein